MIEIIQWFANTFKWPLLIIFGLIFVSMVAVGFLGGWLRDNADKLDEDYYDVVQQEDDDSNL